MRVLTLLVAVAGCGKPVLPVDGPPPLYDRARVLEVALTPVRGVFEGTLYAPGW